MAQRALRMLVILTAVTGVVLMHGVDAGASAAHDSVPAVAHEHHDPDQDSAGAGATSTHWHQIAIACVAIVTTLATFVARFRATAWRRPRLFAVASSWVSPAPRALGAGPPVWLDLAVIRR